MYPQTDPGSSFLVMQLLVMQLCEEEKESKRFFCNLILLYVCFSIIIQLYQRYLLMPY